MWLWALITVYLLVGFFFEKPEGWNIIAKIILHILWLPLLIFVMIVVRLGGARIL